MESEFIVRQATEEDIPEIIRFICENWSENHIFVKSRDFFRYMLCDSDGVNVILAVDSNNRIYGLEGCTFYNSSDTPDSSGMMWRCLKTSDVLLGIKIDQYMQTYRKQKFHFGIGANPNTTIKITKKFYKHYTGKMDHFYRLNGNMKEYNIAFVVHKDILPPIESSSKLERINGVQQLQKILPENMLKKYVPYKDMAYLIHRYVEHPIYQYEFYVIKKGEQQTNSVLITRTIPVKERSMIKIIDFIGDNQDLSGLSRSFDELMIEKNAEYIDIYSLGIREEELHRAGFIRLSDGDSNIIPNYFEPFLKKNVDIY